jgi:hypothetical protein
MTTRRTRQLCSAGERFVTAVVLIALTLHGTTPGPDITLRAIRAALANAELAALYQAIIDKGRAHQECGRRIRAALNATAGRRVWLTGSSGDVIGSYTELFEG